MKGDAGEMVVKYADYADAAGKPDIPIRVAVTRSTMMRTVAKKSGVICTRIRGGLCSFETTALSALMTMTWRA